MVESDPRINIEPNFYYTQEDILIKYRKTRMLKYNITHPSWILGAVQGPLMSIFYPQGFLLVASDLYTLLYPEKVVEPPSPMAGRPVSVVHTMRFVLPSYSYIDLYSRQIRVA